MDATLEEKIASARRNVADARHIVERQRKLIVRGIGGPDAAAFLKNFEITLAIFEENLERLLRERDKGAGSP